MSMIFNPDRLSIRSDSSKNARAGGSIGTWIKGHAEIRHAYQEKPHRKKKEP
jgi:hypothetical protein